MSSDKPKVSVHEFGTTIVLPCGLTVEGRPRDDQTEIAKELGYGETGDAVLQMVQDHDVLHIVLCDWLGIESRSLMVAAGTVAKDDEQAVAEEAAVMALQKLIRLSARVIPGEALRRRNQEDWAYGSGPVFLDEFEDVEWKQLCADRFERALTPAENNLLIRGPRQHPFVGLNAYMHMINGRAAAFRDEAAYLLWKDQQKELFS
jgi:hypothetical protein